MQTFGIIRDFATSFANGLFRLVYSAVIAAQMVNLLQDREIKA